MSNVAGFVPVEVLPHQMDFIRSRSTHCGLVAGFGAGKSRAATLKTIEKKKRYPGVDVAYYLPTYSLIKDIAFPNFEEMLKMQRIPYDLNQSDKAFHTPLGRIILRSYTNPSTIVGYEVGYSVIDEADIYAKAKMKQVLLKIAARNRTPLPDGAKNSVDFVSTPEGFQFMYEFFVKENTEEKDRELIRAKSNNNPYLPESYFEMLKDLYTEEQLAAYLGGEFVNLTQGTVYHKFDRQRNDTDREIRKGDVLHVGQDFNIGKMHSIIHVVSGLRAFAVGEIVDAFDTEDTISILKQRYPKHQIVIYPDASGDNRSTSSSTSDIKLFRKAGFKIKKNSSNPRVRDRINTMNGGFLNADGKISYYVNTFACPTYTEALEQLSYKNSVPDKTTGLDHPTDAGGYFFYKFKKSKTTRIHA